jgi:hypothetical protein
MTRQGALNVSIPIALLLLATAGVGMANQSEKQGNDGSSPLQLPVTSKDGTFAGTLSIQRFEVRDNRAVAIGVVMGSIARTGSGLGEVVVPVNVGPASAPAPTTAAPMAPQATCEVLRLDIGPVSLNVQGITVLTQPINIDLSGDSSAALGNLVCTALTTVNNVAGLVGLLNQILGLVTGLVGGLVP